MDLGECVMCFQLNASVISKDWTEWLGLGGGLCFVLLAHQCTSFLPRLTQSSI